MTHLDRFSHTHFLVAILQGVGGALAPLVGRSAIARVAPFLAAASPVLAQTGQRVTTGSAAAAAFVHQGAPIHPFCVSFPQERLSRGTPNGFAKCSDSTVVPELRDGWMSASARDQGGFSAYRVLAHKGDRFLLALESSGGGTGQFSDLSWVQVRPANVRNVKDVLGGDRCSNGLSQYRLDGMTLRFAASQSTAAILRLSGVPVPTAVAAQLNAGYGYCDAYANYRYDLVTESLVFASVTLTPDTSAKATDNAAAVRRNPQVCFDEFARHAVVSGRSTLTRAALQAFGARFLRECTR